MVPTVGRLIAELFQVGPGARSVEQIQERVIEQRSAHLRGSDRLDQPAEWMRVLAFHRHLVTDRIFSEIGVQSC